MKCERCHTEGKAWVVSQFNTQKICFACRSRERTHPRYEEACKAEFEAIDHGDFNFPGIGLPADLASQPAVPPDERTIRGDDLKRVLAALETQLVQLNAGGIAADEAGGDHATILDLYKRMGGTEAPEAF